MHMHKREICTNSMLSVWDLHMAGNRLGHRGPISGTPPPPPPPPRAYMLMPDWNGYQQAHHNVRTDIVPISSPFTTFFHHFHISPCQILLFCIFLCLISSISLFPSYTSSNSVNRMQILMCTFMPRKPKTTKFKKQIFYDVMFNVYVPSAQNAVPRHLCYVFLVIFWQHSACRMDTLHLVRALSIRHSACSMAVCNRYSACSLGTLQHGTKHRHSALCNRHSACSLGTLQHGHSATATLQ
jgi:hypothetical protein